MQAELEYCGTTSFFMRVLLDKKYALPYRVIDALVSSRHGIRHGMVPGRCNMAWRQGIVAWHDMLPGYHGTTRCQGAAA